MAKKIVSGPTVGQLYEQLDDGFDEKAFYELQRSAPPIIDAITALVEAGESPQEIKGHISRKYANRWLEAQTVEQAARYVEAMG